MCLIEPWTVSGSWGAPCAHKVYDKSTATSSSPRFIVFSGYDVMNPTNDLTTTAYAHVFHHVFAALKHVQSHSGLHQPASTPPNFHVSTPINFVPTFCVEDCLHTSAPTQRNFGAY